LSAAEQLETTGAPPGSSNRRIPSAEQHRSDVQVDLVDQSALEELSADRGRETSEKLSGIGDAAVLAQARAAVAALRN
jgi:hypothetical protein